RNKLRSDPEYRENQRISNKKWQHNNPDYWKRYRQNNPAKTARNRSLQRVRNKRRASPSSSQAESKTRLIAKMDATNLNCDGLSGPYWLVPVIAKMDAMKIYIHVVPGC
ncbi:MAG: hypothetical protein JRJ37_12350, partial [Deltaproteobacteria bacterium]|nr:hypothetical protein [Deltaproteobacteria bacterium]